MISMNIAVNKDEKNHAEKPEERRNENHSTEEKTQKRVQTICCIGFIGLFGKLSATREKEQGC